MNMILIAAAASGTTILTTIGLAVTWIRKPAPAADVTAIECGLGA
jgi:hypothetical protein